MSASNCSCGGCGCASCQPANVIYSGTCTDPGTIASGRHLSVLDYKFCEKRLTNGVGILNAVQLGSGGYAINWTNTPKIALESYQSVQDAAFGNIVILGSDNILRQLLVPAASGLFLQTDGAGNPVFGSPPSAVVPDPLAINELNVAVEATIEDLEVNGDLTLPNAAPGTIVSLLGLDATNKVVEQAVSAGVAASMFYESNVSPSSTAPNLSKNNGEFLVIGNRIFDSGASLVNVTTSELVTVAVAGLYYITFSAVIRMQSNSRAGISLIINGIDVNDAGRFDSDISTIPDGQVAQFNSFEIRRLAVGDALQVQLSATSADPETFNARVGFIKLAD